MAQRTCISALRRSRLMPVPFVIILCMCATLNSVVGQELLGATAYARVWLRVSDAGVSCTGDCNTDGQVTVDEILTMVNIALGSADVSTCMAGDANHDDEVTIDEILTAVNNALNKCPMSGSVGPEGGQVEGPGGLVVTFPPGSVSSTVGVQIASVDAESLPSQVTSALQQAAMTFVLAFHFDTGGVILQTPVQFSAPNAADIPPGPALVLQLMTSTSGAASAAALSSAGTPAFLVDIAEITNAGITGGQPPFPGITTSGTFIVAGPPSGTTSLFGHGFVTDAAGLAVAKAVVQNLSTPFSSVTGSDGGYVLYLGSVDALNLPTSATIVAEYPLSSSAGVLNWVIPWITPIPGGGIVITGIDGQIKLVVGPKDLANEIEEFCSQCSEPIRNAIGAVWENVLALQNVQATPIPFHGPLTVGVGDEQAFSSDPVSGPAPLKASLPSLEAIGCGNVEAKVIGLEFFFDLPTVIVLPTPPRPDPSIAAVIPAPTIQNLGNNHFQLHVTLRGVSPGDTTLIADVFLGQVGIEASLGASFFPVFGCPATVVPRVEGHANLTGYYAADFASPKTPGVTVSVKGPTPTPTPTPFGQELSGTITYTGSRVQVSASEPIIILLAAFDPNVHGVDRAYVPVNGGPFVLHAPAAGNYYLLYSVDVHNYQDGALSVGAPFEVYNNRHTVSFPAPFPADPVVVPQVGFNLDFGDAGIITGVAGTVAYTGNRSCGCIDIEAFANPGFSGAPDRDWYDSGCREPNGRYELAFLDPGRPYYLRAFVDINDNRQLDPGEPFAIYGSNPVAAGPAQTNVNFSFGDPIAPAAQGLRVYVAPGSTGNAYVYGGPIPSSSNGGDIADHPESHGYVFLGTIGVGSNGPYDFDGPYPYFLIKVTSSVIIPGSPSVNIDALQNIETSTFLSGRTCNGPPGLAFYDSNAGSLDNTKGPPDGEYSQLNGYMLYPVIAWSAY